MHTGFSGDRYSGLVTSISLRIFHSFLMFHRVKGFSIVNEEEIDVFLELPWFLHDPTNVGNLISGSFTFSKSKLYLLKFSVHVLMKTSFRNFEHNLARMWNETNCTVVSTFFGIGMKIDPFWSCGHCWVFQICWHIECSTLTASSFQIWNRSAGIPLPPLALFVIILPSWLYIPGCLALGEWSQHCDYLSLRPFLYSSVYSCHLKSSASVRSISFLSFLCSSLHEMFPWYL